MNPPATRPAGVTVIAVVLVLGSLFLLLVAAASYFTFDTIEQSPATGQPPVAVIPGMKFIVLGFYSLLGGWGLSTAIGLLRMKEWGRISALLIAATTVFVAFSGVLAMAFILPSMIPASDDPVLRRSFFLVMGVVLGVQFGLGTWWMIYLLRPKVRAAFALGAPPAPPEPHPLPLSIVVIGWYLLTTMPLGFVAPVLDFPVLYFGVILTGWLAKLAPVVWALAGTVAGWGLLKKKEFAWGLAVAVLALAVLSTLMPFVRPQVAAEYEGLLMAQHPAMYDGLEKISGWFFVLTTVPGLLLPLYFLLTRKQKYLEAARGGV